jgi:hypothetical protein
MSKPKAVLAMLAIILCGFIPALAQENDSVCSQIGNSVRDRTRLWKLDRKSHSCNKMSYFKWTSGKSVIYAFIYPESSVKEATEIYGLLADDDELLSVKIEVLGTGLREFGGDNRLWVTPKAKQTGLDFRKGKVVVRVSGSTMELAIQFSKYIAEGIPDA